MTAGLQVPYWQIKSSSPEEIERAVTEIELSGIESKVRATEFDILNDRELCRGLGIDYVTLNHSIKARYAAILVVVEGYSL